MWVPAGKYWWLHSWGKQWLSNVSAYIFCIFCKNNDYLFCKWKIYSICSGDKFKCTRTSTQNWNPTGKSENWNLKIPSFFEIWKYSEFFITNLSQLFQASLLIYCNLALMFSFCIKAFFSVVLACFVCRCQSTTASSLWSDYETIFANRLHATFDLDDTFKNALEFANTMESFEIQMEYVCENYEPNQVKGIGMPSKIQNSNIFTKQSWLI